MEKQNLILIQSICVHYDIDQSFLRELHSIGRIEIYFLEEKEFIHEEHVGEIEKMIRMYKDLNVNIEGIDVVFNMLEKERQLKEELADLKRQLQFYRENTK
ncbi:MerR family transcriptional regulator [Brumimicrobium salinarum]|uniref:MerR family transcriptional regulator n=1 Tax=Brumimicrobium salinarum TaxID=2058658 RepID=A0A2I0QZ84_9FLAO|nr:chaperone modulator CbpM [Brumimicrobium salinarum]PKR79638.1 MerR family transcriptional regulator [Brumimicrobium salinarum]